MKCVACHTPIVERQVFSTTGVGTEGWEIVEQVDHRRHDRIRCDAASGRAALREALEAFVIAHERYGVPALKRDLDAARAALEAEKERSRG